MTAISVSAPFPILTDIDGSPLDAGYVYIGQANLDPVAFPKSVYWDASLTTPAAQPIRTSGGYPVRNGSPARIYTDGDYSIRINNKNGTLVYSSPASTDRLDSWQIGYDGGTVQGVLDVVTGPSGAASVGYMPAGIGAVATTVQEKLRETVSVKDFGAVGDWNGTTGTNDRDAILAAITYAAGRTVVLESGKTYLLGSAIVFSGDVSLRTDGADKAVIFHNGQSFDPITIQGALAATTTLNASQQVNNRGWSVASTTGIKPGMLMEVKSSVSWYHDPRPESSDARKSELHRVAYISGGTVYTEDPANDGYNVPTETVTLSFYSPVSVRMENVVVKCVLPTPAVAAPAVTGVNIKYANEPLLLDVDVENASYTGVFLRGCYRPVVERGRTHSANFFDTGYGVQTYGCSHPVVRDRTFWNCRRGVDISGGQIITRHALIEDCTNMGGGMDSEGTPYGWLNDGTPGSLQYGFGSHGPADHTIYRGNRVANMSMAFNLRGRNEIIEGNYCIGRFYNGVVYLGTGENVWITGNKVYAGWSSLKDGTAYEGSPAAVVLSVATVNDSSNITINGVGQTTDSLTIGSVVSGNAAIPAGAFVTRIINSTTAIISAPATITQTDSTTTFTPDASYRALSFVTINAQHSGGEIVVAENDVQVSSRFLWFTAGSSAVKPGMRISGNKVRFATSPNTQDVFFAFNDGAAAFATDWVMFDNDYKRTDGGATDVTVFRSITANSTTKLADTIYSGTYTPTLTNVTNVDASTASTCHFMRVGNCVTVSGRFAIDPTTANTYTEMRMSLPVASPNLSSIRLGGTGSSLPGNTMNFTASGEATAKEAIFTGTPTVSTNQFVYFNFTYWIL